MNIATSIFYPQKFTSYIEFSLRIFHSLGIFTKKQHFEDTDERQSPPNKQFESYPPTKPVGEK
jgi:hypothetical protein